MPTFSNRRPNGTSVKKSRRSDETRPVEPVQDEPLLSNEWIQDLDDRMEKNPPNDDH